MFLLLIACGGSDPAPAPAPTPTPTTPAAPSVAVPEGPAPVPTVAPRTDCEGLAGKGTCVSERVFTQGDREVWTTRFRVSEKPMTDEYDPDCHAPTPAEWMSARAAGFKAGAKAYNLASPVTDQCNWSPEELEAEGVVGSLYFGGEPAKKPTDGREDYAGDVFSVASVVYYFWDDTPSPEGRVCATRDQAGPQTVYVQASTLNVRKKRSADAGIAGRVAIGDSVALYGQSGEWAYIGMPEGGKDHSFLAPEGTGELNSGEEWTCPAFGWVKTEYLGLSAPTLETLRAQADAYKQLGDEAKALSALQRAAALAPDDVALLNQLADQYELTGDSERAARVRETAKKAGQ